MSFFLLFQNGLFHGDLGHHAEYQGDGGGGKEPLPEGIGSGLGVLAQDPQDQDAHRIVEHIDIQGDAAQVGKQLIGSAVVQQGGETVLVQQGKAHQPLRKMAAAGVTRPAKVSSFLHRPQ